MDKKSLNFLASKIAKAEGKKIQVKIGDIREILKIMVGLELGEFSERPSTILMSEAFVKNAKNIKKGVSMAKCKPKPTPKPKTK